MISIFQSLSYKSSIVAVAAVFVIPIFQHLEDQYFLLQVFLFVVVAAVAVVVLQFLAQIVVAVVVG